MSGNAGGKQSLSQGVYHLSALYFPQCGVVRRLCNGGEAGRVFHDGCPGSFSWCEL